MTSGTNLRRLKSGGEITDFFVIRKKEIRLKKSDGNPYLALELGNATGRISATIWEDVEERSDHYKVGDLIKIFGKVVDYKDGQNLVIEKIRKAREEDQLHHENFLPGAKKDIKELRNQFKQLISSIENPRLQNLLERIFSDRSICSTFESAPGGKLWHHNRKSGLLEHSLSVASICDFLSKKYSLIDRDLVISGALLHDLGKIHSYSTELGFIDYTDEGRLTGHITIGVNLLNQFLSEIPEFPSELRKQLLHLIVSHHGKLEQGSPVVPMTLEALVLYYADELDSNADAFQRIRENEKTDEQQWSKYVRLLERFLYFPEKGNDEDVGEEG